MLPQPPLQQLTNAVDPDRLVFAQYAPTSLPLWNVAQAVPARASVESMAAAVPRVVLLRRSFIFFLIRLSAPVKPVRVQFILDNCIIVGFY